MRIDRRELGAIAVGGYVGAIARTGLAEAAPHNPSAWPWTTFVVNLVGTFLLGWFAVRLQERLPLSSYRRPLLGTGLCGALTTFSTMQLELVRMVDGGHVPLAVAYGAASIAGGLLCVWLAVSVARRVRVVV